MGRVCGLRSIEGRPEGLHYDYQWSCPIRPAYLAAAAEDVAGRFTTVTVICDGYCFE